MWKVGGVGKGKGCSSWLLSSPYFSPSVSSSSSSSTLSSSRINFNCHNNRHNLFGCASSPSRFFSGSIQNHNLWKKVSLFIASRTYTTGNSNSMINLCASKLRRQCDSKARFKFNSLNRPLSKFAGVTADVRVKNSGCSLLSLSVNNSLIETRRGFASFSFPIPGTSAAAAAKGLVEGTVVERQIWIENETFRRHEFRTGHLRRRSGFEPSMVWTKLGLPAQGTSTRSRLSSEEITCIAEEFLGSDRFSANSSLSHNFGPFQDIISLFLFKVAHIDHPLLHVTKIIEAEPSQSLREVRKNPYPLWRAMMVLLTTEMYGFPKDISLAPPEIHWAIKDKHNRVSKISEIAWITHQLHRRVLDISSLTPARLSALYNSSNSRSSSSGSGSSLNSSSNPSMTVNAQEQMKILENLHKANKATTLVGDLLLTQKCAHLAALKSPPVTELICNSLADFCESEFELGVKSGQPRHFNYESWLSRCELGLGSLLGHCMYSALLFSGFDTATRNHAFKLGSVLGILYQAYDDISFFNREELTQPSWMDVGILPSVYQVQRHPDLLLKSHAEIFQAVKSSSFAMEESLDTFNFLKEHALKTLAGHEHVQNTTARDLLINFVHSLSPLNHNNNNNNNNIKPPASSS